MACESFKLIDSSGTETYFADLNLFIGNTSGGMSSENFMPNIKSVTVDDIVKKDGSIFQSQNLGERDIEIPVYFINLTEEEINIIKQKLYVRTPKKLIYDRHPYRYIWVNSTKSIDVSYIWRGGTRYDGIFTISYVAYDPLWYSLFDAGDLPAYLEDLPSSGHEQLFYDLGMPYEEDILPTSFVNVTSDGSLVLQNYGSYDSKLTIEIIGDCQDLTLTNISNENKSFTINTMSSETIKVDGTRGIISNGSILKTNSFSGDFIKLVAGENIIVLSSTSINLSSLNFIYKYTYL